MARQDWTRCTLAAISRKPISYGVVQTGDPIVGGVPCVRVLDLTGRELDPSRMITTSQEIHKAYARTILERDEILFALRGDIGTVRMVPPELVGANITRGVARISPKQEECSPQYVLQYLCSPVAQRDLKLRTNGSALQEIPIEQLRKLPIVLPPRDEQEKIAAVLRCWDQAAETSYDLIAAKVRFKQGLMQQLLVGKRRCLKFTSSSFVERHVGEVFRETFRPVQWNDDELYRLASIRRHSGGLFWREALYGKQIKVKKLHALCEGDFLISHIQAAYGAMGLVPAEFVGGTVSEMYTILTPKTPGTIDMRYVDYLSQMKRMRHQAYLACNGFFAERLRLNFDPAEFLKQKILLPESVKEQRMIADLLDTLVSEIRLLERELDALKKQKKGLMQKLLTGQVRVKP